TITWPEIGVEFAKREIENSTLPLTAYDETARIIQKAFEDHGAPSLAYQVIVLPTSENYVNITDFHGVDVHVFRYNRSEVTGNSGKAKKWMKSKKGDILKAIKHGALMKTSTVFNSLHQDSKIGPIYGEDRFQSMIIIRNKEKTTSTTVRFPIGMAIDEDSSYKLEQSRTSYSVLDNGKETLYTFLLVLLLVTSDVKAFISKYRELNETKDVIKGLERIGEESRELFKLGRPVGVLMASFNSTGK
ncbi:hypothetical protein PMAYCL1PPCAC_13111, partial [Pristionchus mayeri]